MILEIRLCDADRELFGVDEWLPFEILDITVGDLEELSGRCKFDPEDWPDVFWGQLNYEQVQAGETKAKKPTWHSRAMVWILLRQNGLDVSWEDVGKAKPLLMLVRSSSPGKDPEESPASDISTTQPSPTSSGSRRTTSTK